MPYDLHTINGIVPGQVSPQEQFEAQRRDAAMRNHAALLEAKARDAQTRVLKEAAGGGDGGISTGNDDFFAKAFGGGASARPPSGMVSGVKPTVAPGEYGSDAYFQNRRRDRANTGVAEAEAQNKLTDLARRQRAGSELDNLLGLGGAAAPAAGGAPAAGATPALGGTSDDALMRMAILGAMAGGQSMPDVGGYLTQRSKAASEADLNKLKIKAQEMELAQAQRKIDEEAANKRRSAGAAKPGDEPTPLAPIEEFLAQNKGLTDPLASRATGFAEQDASTIGWDPTDQDVDSVVAERDNLAGMLAKRGYPREEALRQANLLIQRSVQPNSSDINSGWIQKLLQRIGAAKPPAMVDDQNTVGGP